MVLHNLLDYWAYQQPDAEFAVMSERRLTYQQALEATNQFAHTLISAGLGIGDRIAILSKNRIEYALMYFAASKVGAVPVPLNFRLVPQQWEYILNDSQAQTILCGPEYAQPIQEIRDSLETVERFVCFDSADIPGWITYQEWTSNQPNTHPDVSLPENADLYQMYTSGTTGHPKGAVLSHRAVTANILQIGFARRVEPGERSLVVLPMFHAAILPTTLSVVAWGGSLFILETFDPHEVVRVMSEERIVVATLVPAMIQACLLNVPDVYQRGYDNLRSIYYGASPITEQTLRNAMDAFPSDFIQSYGMTEATQSVSFLMPEDHKKALAETPELLLSGGRAAMWTEMRIVDEFGNPLPNGTTGEIAVRGPQLMRRYYNRPEETEKAMRGGWLHTGDAGMIDAEGFLFVQDRVKDMIISGGENVYPSVVENVLYQHPAVAEAAVIGVPDKKWGETVKAVVVLKAGVTATEEQIINFCKGKLAGFERPTSVDFEATLPRNPSGKVLKRVLRDPYWEGHSRQVAGV